MAHSYGGKKFAVVNEKYCRPEPTLLIMEEKFSIHDNAEVRDDKGNVVFHLKGKAFSAHFKRVLLDLEDKPVFSLYQKFWSFSSRTWIFPGLDPTPDPKTAFFEARQKMWSFKPQLEIFLDGVGDRTPDVFVKGEFINRNFKVTNAEGETLAEISRQMSVLSLMNDIDSYTIRIMPNVDIAFILGVTLCVDVIIIEAEHRDD